YFSNPDFSGKPALVRSDSQIQFNWDAAAPAPGIPMKAFSVRWTGTLTPPGPGDYTFGIHQPDCYPCEDHEAFNVYLDGKLVLSSTGFNRKPAPGTFKMHFNNAEPHTLRFDYSHRSPLFGAGVTLEWKAPVDVLREQAVRVAKQADVVVAFVGLSPHLEGEEMRIHIPGFDGGDRTNLQLPDAQKDLLRALAATGKPLVVVLLNGSALAANWAEEHAAAILDAWYPGEAGGTAIAETLAGANNPAGRLPVTFYKSVGQLPPFADYSMKNRTYRYFTGEPLYGFGYGLSYSSFVFSNLHLSTRTVKAGQPLTVEAEVKNTSGVAGDEVCELYIEYGHRPDAPLRALKGFQRIHLAPGQTRRVSFTLAPRDLSLATEAGALVVEPGSYTVFVGGSQPGKGAAGVSATFQITGRKVESTGLVNP
ncbi:MAG: glycoside hydrolase family 3 C-terminal domain-containing protein, partial [Limisphaerales bacterium]